MSESILRHSDSKNVYIKNITAFGFMFALSVLAGVLCCSNYDFSVSDKISVQIISHFADAFYGCDDYSDYISVVIKASLSDLRHLAFVFAAGFTMFCGLACCVVNFCRGFTFGFSAAYLLLMIQSGISDFSSPKVEFVLFIISKLLIGAVIVYLSARANIFGYEFRKLRGRKSAIIRSPVIYKYILVFVIMFGFIVLVNTAYCAIGAYIQL